MAMSVKNNVIRLTADNDTYGSAGPKLKIKGVRLVAGTDAATALIKATNTAGDVLYSLKAAAEGVDEGRICFTCDSGVIHVDLTGTSSEVFLYLE